MFKGGVEKISGGKKNLNNNTDNRKTANIFQHSTEPNTQQMN